MRLNCWTKRPIAYLGLYGYDKSVKGNSLPPFALAALGNYTVYCDIQLSHNGVPMAFHRSSLEQIAGFKTRVSIYVRQKLQKSVPMTVIRIFSHSRNLFKILLEKFLFWPI